MLKYEKSYVEYIVGNAGFPLSSIMQKDTRNSLLGGASTAPLDGLIIPVGLHYSKSNSQKETNVSQQYADVIDDVLFEKMFSKIAHIYEKKTPRKTMKKKENNKSA